MGWDELHTLALVGPYGIADRLEAHWRDYREELACLADDFNQANRHHRRRIHAGRMALAMRLAQEAM